MYGVFAWAICLVISCVLTGRNTRRSALMTFFSCPHGHNGYTNLHVSKVDQGQNFPKVARISEHIFHLVLMAGSRFSPLHRSRLCDPSIWRPSIRCKQGPGVPGKILSSWPGPAMPICHHRADELLLK